VADHEFHTATLRIRIIALPGPGEFDEFDLKHFRVGNMYDVPPRLASLLVIAGYAEPASARAERAEAADHSRRGSRTTSD
jgi:hypothetical protein